ncbi:MAG: hypothetical protein CMM99_04370 [Rickettsiales bacterium]|nr:hypothetical protein [Rickettsiales bacterium]
MISNLRIQRLVLNNFRNHKFLRIDSKKSIILIHGKNGSGKTNILESISLLDSSSGLKNANLVDIINNELEDPKGVFGANFNLCENGETFNIGLGLKKTQNGLSKLIRINEKKSGFDEIKKLISIFWIVPRMGFIFQMTSEDRRNFLDFMISSVDLLHKKRLVTYEKYKRERIKILKNFKQKKTNNSWLDILEEKMVLTGLMICDSRRNFLKAINEILIDLKLGMPKLTISLKGELDSKLSKNPSLYVEEFFLKKLKANRIKDTITGRTNFSVNKTDLIVNESNKNKLAENFSTGEQKIIVITIIFSFLRYLKQADFKRIIFLLDDVFSYLDQRFTNLILDELKGLNSQTWITDIRTDWIEKNNELRALVDKINIDDYRFKVAN